MNDSALRFASLASIASLVEAGSGRDDDVVGQAARDVAALMSTERVWVCLRRSRRTETVYRYATGEAVASRGQNTASRGEYVTVGSDALLGRALNARRAARFEHEQQYADTAAASERWSVCMAPVQSGRHTTGALLAFRVADAAFVDADADVLAEAASALSLVLTTHDARRRFSTASAPTAADAVAPPDGERTAAAYSAAVAEIVQALQAKDATTHQHAGATSRLAVAVGRELSLPARQLRDLEFAARLHDVGKIAIPDEVLNRPGPLTDSEWGFIRDHTRIGERILRGIPFLAEAARAVRSAHERWDGTGYPDGLAGEHIPILARIVFACDTWDVMTSDRPYRPALSTAEARRRLTQASGSQLDARVVTALLTVLDRRAASPLADAPCAA